MDLHTFQTAVQLAQQGDRQRAFQILSGFLQSSPGYAPAWLWMSGLVDDPGHQRECLERVLALDPTCAAARRGLALLGAGQLPTPNAPPAGHTIGAYLVAYGFL